MKRILSQSGNVIAADFRPRPALTISIGFKSEILYRDDAVLLTRITALLDDRPIMTTHFIGNLATGQIATL